MLALCALCFLGVIYAPIHYAWRTSYNERLFRSQRIDKDEWVLAQVFIPIESWAIGIIAGISAAAILVCTFKRKADGSP
jgi:hypothetical protein